MDSIEKLWDRLDAWFQANALPLSSVGASEKELELAQTRMNIILPEDFKASYRRHNGGWPFPPWFQAYPLDHIVSVWEMYKDIWDQGDPDDSFFPDQPPGPIKPFHWQPRWLPLVPGGYGRDHVCLDLDPGPGGQLGQLIFHTHECDPATLVAPSFHGWLASFADDLETGNYLFTKIYDPVQGQDVPTLRRQESSD